MPASPSRRAACRLSSHSRGTTSSTKSSTRPQFAASIRSSTAARTAIAGPQRPDTVRAACKYRGIGSVGEPRSSWLRPERGDCGDALLCLASHSGVREKLVGECRSGSLASPLSSSYCAWSMPLAGQAGDEPPFSQIAAPRLASRLNSDFGAGDGVWAPGRKVPIGTGYRELGALTDCIARQLTHGYLDRSLPGLHRRFGRSNMAAGPAAAAGPLSPTP